MKKATNRAPKDIGPCHLVEMPYKRNGVIVPDEFRVDLTARTPRLHKSFRNWRAAEEFAHEEMKRREATKDKITSYSFNDAADGYEKECEQRMRAKVPTLSPQTYAVYRRNLSLAREKFGKIPLHKFKSQHLRDWGLELAAEVSTGNHERPLSGSVGGPEIRGAARYAIRQSAVHDPVEWPKSAVRRDAPPRSEMDQLAEFMFGHKPANLLILAGPVTG